MNSKLSADGPKGIEYRDKASNKIFFLVPLMIGLSYSIYAVTLRTIVGENAQSDYSLMILITSMETIPGIFSIIAGYYSDKFGKKVPLLFGLIASVSLAAFPFISFEALPFFVFTFITMYTIYTTFVYGAILRRAEGSGKKLSLFLMMFSIGWTSGGFFPSLLSMAGHVDFAFILSAILLMASAGISLSKFDLKMSEREKFSLKSLKESITVTRKIMAGLILWSSGYYMLSGIFSLKLYSSVSSQFEYGIYFTVITGFLSIIARPYAGIMADRFTPEKTLIFSIAAYMLVSISLIWSPPLLVILLWILPIYPFFDTSIYSLLSRMMPFELQATAAGVISTSISIGGILNLVLYYILRSKAFAFLSAVDSILLALSLVWFTAIFRKR